VFALLRGGSCHGVVYRIARERAANELERLWAREMVTGVYDPKWLRCRTPQADVEALAFTLHRSSPSYIGSLPDEELLRILRDAQGRYGTTLEYVLQTARALSEHGVRDREIERLVALARRHRLV